ncbi:MAG: GNAT family N-acetyltransferase [Rhizobiales bacterium]|nr:GNAT family N-acetyltransferase [Hyphomicrobiales bacterium]
MQRERYSATLHDWAGWHARQQSGRFRRTAFQHPAFLASFYREKPGHCEEIVVSLFDHRLQRVVMALPLVMHRQAGLRRIEAADLGLADYVAPLVAEDLSDDPAEADAMWAAILKALPQADVVSFKKMPPEIRPGTPNPLAHLPGALDMGIHTQVFALTDDDGDRPYRRTGYYKEGQRHLRRLTAAHDDVRFHIAATVPEANRQFDALIAQRATRAVELGRDDPLLLAHVQRFYRGLFADGIANGDVMFGALYAGGECIATDLGLVDGDTHHGVLTSMTSGTMRRFSPGTVAHVLMLDACAERGISHYDLGVGEFAYKKRLNARAVPLYERHEALSLRGRLGLAEASIRRRVRFGVQAYPTLRAPVQRLRTQLKAMRYRTVATMTIVFDNPVVQGATYSTLSAF